MNSLSTKAPLLTALAALALLFSAGVVQAQSGARNAGAEQFVQVEAQRALDILRQQRGRPAEEKRQFRAFVDQVADVPRITYFVLGKYSRSITPTQKQAFAPLFRRFAANVYETRLSDYHGETLRVTGSVARTPTDVVVSSLVSGGKLDEPLPVAWRVIAADDGFKVVDVQVKGVWLAITEQQDFVSTIDNAGGDIDVLIAQLRKQAADSDGR